MRGRRMRQRPTNPRQTARGVGSGAIVKPQCRYGKPSRSNYATVAKKKVGGALRTTTSAPPTVDPSGRRPPVVLTQSTITRNACSAPSRRAKRTTLAFGRGRPAGASLVGRRISIALAGEMKSPNHSRHFALALANVKHAFTDYLEPVVLALVGFAAARGDDGTAGVGSGKISRCAASTP